MGSPFLEAEKMKRIENLCSNNKIMLIIKTLIWTIGLG
jgi:hypothetical protein